MIDLSHLHPMIIHFPIALIIIGFLSDLVGAITKRHFFTQAGLYLMALGSIGTIAAFFSGRMAGDGVTEAGALGMALETHEGAATLALWTVIVLAIMRITLAVTRQMAGWKQWVMVALLAVGVATISRAGYYGGQLVYEHAAGVQLNFGFGSPASDVSTEEPAESAMTNDNDN